MRKGNVYRSPRAVLAMLLTACASSPSAPPARLNAASETFSAPVADGMVEIGGGLSLHVHCTGSGSPIVVFDAGMGDHGNRWNDVTREVQRFARACVYDRAGTGYSSPAPPHHTSRQIVAELHALLAAARVSGPYVLVGHSMGGLNVRLFTTQYPQEVVGMVQVDGTHEDAGPRFWKFLTPDQMRDLEATWRGHHFEYDLDAYRDSLAQVRGSNRFLGDIPLVVLTHGKRLPLEPDKSEEQVLANERVLQETQADLVKLSSNSVQVIAEKSGHYIQVDEPKLVVAAIHEVVDAVRAHRRVDKDRVLTYAGKGTP